MTKTSLSPPSTEIRVVNPSLRGGWLRRRREGRRWNRKPPLHNKGNPSFLGGRPVLGISMPLINFHGQGWTQKIRWVFPLHSINFQTKDPERRKNEIIFAVFLLAPKLRRKIRDHLMKIAKHFRTIEET
jgi:hypothetical protein